jgi:hypothetical protein
MKRSRYNAMRILGAGMTVEEWPFRAALEGKKEPLAHVELQSAKRIDLDL